jgi:hypothetical protein
MKVRKAVSCLNIVKVGGLTGTANQYQLSNVLFVACLISMSIPCLYSCSCLQEILWYCNVSLSIQNTTKFIIYFYFFCKSPIFIIISESWNFMQLKLFFLFNFRKNLILAETGKILQNLISTIFKITLLVEYRSFVNECIGLCRRGGALNYEEKIVVSNRPLSLFIIRKYLWPCRH